MMKQDLFEKLFIRNELTRKRYRKFKKNKTAVVSLWVFLILCFFSYTAEFWANSRPVIMSYKGEIYFPVLKDYHPSEFGREDLFVADYRALNISENGWAIWPPISWNPYERNTQLYTYPSPPSSENWLGTDDRGRDILSRLLYGFRYTSIFALGVWVLTLIVGIITGALMGFYGGKVDLVGQRVVEIFESMPYLMVLITLVAMFSPNFGMLILLTVFFGWTFFSVYTRGEFLALRKREFAEAARALGAGNGRIVFRHILPNALTPVVTFSPFIIASYIGTLAILDYLGVGLQAPTPSWGELLGQAQRYFQHAWWLALFPSLALFGTLLILNTIGTAIRDAFDAKKTI